jgi:hypothetical protein
MEIFLHGPGGTMTTHPLTDKVYNYFKDKSSKFLFDYSWDLDVVWKNHENKNHENKTKLNIPKYADFLGDYWCQNRDAKRTVNLCDYNNSVLFVELDNKVSMHYPDELTSIESEQEYPCNLNKFYSGVSCEIGNWQHKKYKKFIPLEDLTLYVKTINNRKYIIDFTFGETIYEKECYNMYKEVALDWYYRLHVRNKYIVEDLSKFSNVDLSYDMNSETLHVEEEDYNILDTSNFKIHNNDSS